MRGEASADLAPPAPLPRSGGEGSQTTGQPHRASESGAIRRIRMRKTALSAASPSGDPEDLGRRARRNLCWFVLFLLATPSSCVGAIVLTTMMPELSRGGLILAGLLLFFAGLVGMLLTFANWIAYKGAARQAL